MQTSAEEIYTMAQPTAILSNLSGEDAATAADQIQAVINQFDLLEEDSMHIADVYDKISSNIKMDYSKGIEGIAEGVETVGNVANQAGLSFEQLSSIIATTMEQTRQAGSQIGNGVKTILTRISKASTMSDEVDNETLSNASKVLHDIGVEVYETTGEYREFDTIMTELAEKWDTLTDAQQANISYQVAATRQVCLYVQKCA
jgi:TP901 family phage tail tape measure protein